MQQEQINPTAMRDDAPVQSVHRPAFPVGSLPTVIVDCLWCGEPLGSLYGTDFCDEDCTVQWWDRAADSWCQT